MAYPNRGQLPPTAHSPANNRRAPSLPLHIIDQRAPLNGSVRAYTYIYADSMNHMHTTEKEMTATCCIIVNESDRVTSERNHNKELQHKTIAQEGTASDFTRCQIID